MAFMLSPGVLFPAAYLFLYLSTNIYLNADFKTNLSKSVERATGNTWQTNISSIKPGWGFDSMTLNHVELTKATNRGIWFGFQGLCTSPSLVLNIASISHDPNEVERCSLSDINYEWR